MLIECDSCAVRDLECDGCIVTELLGIPEGTTGVDIDEGERRALTVLADVGLVPPLRHTGRAS
jgi:hypothetical protein